MREFTQNANELQKHNARLEYIAPTNARSWHGMACERERERVCNAMRCDAYIDCVRVGERPERQTGADVGLDDVRVHSGLGALLADDPGHLEPDARAAADAHCERLALRLLSESNTKSCPYEHLDSIRTYADKTDSTK